MKTRNRIAALVLVLMMAAAVLVGCTNRQQDTVTIYETDALKIERQGAQTRICDLVGNSTYTFTTHRTRASKDAVQEAQTTAKTETIEIKTVHGIIIVTTDAGTIYIK
jgi:uncharacterized lipoprotein NlpE involved in copper resistance